MMKITQANAAAIVAIVLFWRRRKASAPALIASETSRIAGVPVSRARTHLMRYPAKARPITLIAKMSPSSVIARFSLRALARLAWRVQLPLLGTSTIDIAEDLTPPCQCAGTSRWCRFRYPPGVGLADNQNAGAT